MSSGLFLTVTRTSNTSGVITHADKNVQNPIWDLLYFGMHRDNIPTELERNEVPGHDGASGWLRLTAGSHVSMKQEKYSSKYEYQCNLNVVIGPSEQLATCFIAKESIVYCYILDVFLEVTSGNYSFSLCS